MASEGIRFTDAYAGFTFCAPSRLVLMAGQHTGHTWVRSNGSEPFQPEGITVAEVVQGSESNVIGLPMELLTDRLELLGM